MTLNLVCGQLNQTGFFFYFPCYHYQLCTNCQWTSINEISVLSSNTFCAQPASLDLFYQILTNLFQDESYSCATSHSPLCLFFCSSSSLSNSSSTFTSHSDLFSQNKSFSFFLGFIFNRTSQSFLSTCSVTIRQLPVAFGSLTRGGTVIYFSMWGFSDDILSQMIKLTIKCSILGGYLILSGRIP